MNKRNKILQHQNGISTVYFCLIIPNTDIDKIIILEDVGKMTIKGKKVIKCDSEEKIDKKIKKMLEIKSLSYIS